MMGNNATVVGKRLDEIRTKMPKFICLNDDMNKTHAPPQQLLQTIADFYMSYFPLPSPFELPPGESNPFLYIDLLREHKHQQKRSFAAVVALVALGAACLALLAYRVFKDFMHVPQRGAGGAGGAGRAAARGLVMV